MQGWQPAGLRPIQPFPSSIFFEQPPAGLDGSMMDAPLSMSSLAQHQQQMYDQNNALQSGPPSSTANADEESPDPSGHPSQAGVAGSSRGSRSAGIAGKKGTKRPRPTLSCTECVRRKSKCDRTIPCATCIKRGTPEKCRVDDEEQRPTQPFAQARELDLLKEKVDKLEQLLYLVAPEQARSLLGESPDYSAVASTSQLPTISPRAPKKPRITTGNSSATDNKDAESDNEADDNEDGQEAEHAAFALESIAVAGRGPMALDIEGVDSALPLTSQARIRESQLRQQEIDFLLSMLPDATLSRSLIDAFFSKVAWHNNIVHQPTFEMQYAPLRQLVEQRKGAELDPAWLSLYFMVIASGLFFSPSRSDITPAHQAEYTNTWVLGAQRALTLADWSGKPQMTCIQTVVLLPVVLMHAGGIKRLASWIAAAVRMAQLLDLHKLDDKARPPKSSPINSYGPVEKEIGKRLYFSLTHGEVNFASRWLGLGHSSGSNHPIPNILNIDDADLLANPPIAKPIEQATVSSFQVIRARIMTADLSARLTGSDARVHKYETVLAFDQRTREILKQLPAYFKYDRSDDPDIRALIAQRPYIAYQRCTILFGLNNRLLRAHRPFMTKGYFDSKYAYSTDSCIRAAKVIIAAQKALRDIFDGADRMYNCLLYCFSSAVVLLVDNFHRLSSPTLMSDTQELDAQRHEALDVLLMLRRESATSTIAQAGAKVLEGIISEEGQRRVQRGLPPAQETFTRNNTPEDEAPTLREVVERIASVSKWPQDRQDTASNKTDSPAATLPAPTLLATNAISHPLPPVVPPTDARPPAISPTATSFSFAFKNQPATSASAVTGLTDSNTSSSAFSSFLHGQPGNGIDTLMSGNDSEDLLRSLGFFEVGSGVMPSMGTVMSSSGDGDIFGMFGGNSNMSQDFGWLEGLGEW